MRNVFIFSFFHVENFVGKIFVRSGFVFDQNVAQILIDAVVWRGQVGRKENVHAHRLLQIFYEFFAGGRNRIHFSARQIFAQKSARANQVRQNQNQKENRAIDFFITIFFHRNFLLREQKENRGKRNEINYVARVGDAARNLLEVRGDGKP